MSERERTEGEQYALDLINEMFVQLSGGAVSHRGRRSRALYYQANDQRRFFYTPWKDANGDYWTWVEKPVGRGAKSGNAKRWQRVGKRVRSRKRKTAQGRAYHRFQQWEHRYNHAYCGCRPKEE